VPSTEQHAGGTGAEIAVAPFGQELTIGHADQYPCAVLALTCSAGGERWERLWRIACIFGKLNRELS
jgi:hypothetical protein